MKHYQPNLNENVQAYPAIRNWKQRQVWSQFCGRGHVVAWPSWFYNSSSKKYIEALWFWQMRMKLHTDIGDHAIITELNTVYIMCL